MPAAVADFPAEIVRPPREWTERVFADLRRWTEFARGGHFAAFEEPELLADDLIAFVAALSTPRRATQCSPTPTCRVGIPASGRRATSSAVRAADLVVDAVTSSAREVLRATCGLAPRLVAVHGNVDEPRLRALLPERLGRR